MTTIAMPSVTAFSELTSPNLDDPTASIETTTAIARQRYPHIRHIAVNGPLPTVVDAALEAMNELLALPPNWDTYAGRPVSVSAATAAISWLLDVASDTLPAPSVVPGSDGSVQFEWHTRDVDLEVRFLSSTDATFLFEDLRTHQESEGRLVESPDVIRSHIDLLASRRDR